MFDSRADYKTLPMHRHVARDTEGADGSQQRRMVPSPVCNGGPNGSYVVSAHTYVQAALGRPTHPSVSLSPEKIKTIDSTGFAHYQAALRNQGMAPMPYCPRQYFNGRGERYIASRSLASGSYGSLHVAVRSSDGVPVALKDIPIDKLWQPSRKAKKANPHAPLDAYGRPIQRNKDGTPLFELGEEIRLALKAHAYLAPLDAFVVNGRAFIVTPLMQGDCFDLAKSVLQDGSTQKQRDLAISLLSQVSHEVARFHAKGVIHRDLKLENILRDATGYFCVADFGGAEALPPTRSVRAVMVGTYGYMPPEAFTGAKTDGRFDVFSLGITVVAAALGRLPFGNNATMVLSNMQALHTWLTKDCPRDGQGNIHIAALARTSGPWADFALDMVAILGPYITGFVLDRMLIGDCAKRATMAEVSAFSTQLSHDNPNAFFRTQMACGKLDSGTPKRGALLASLRCFDEMFPI